MQRITEMTYLSVVVCKHAGAKQAEAIKGKENAIKDANIVVSRSDPISVYLIQHFVLKHAPSLSVDVEDAVANVGY